MNKYGAEKEPFMFIVDFDMKRPEIHKLNSVPPGIKFLTPLLSNVYPGQIYTKPVYFKKHPVPFSIYSEAFRNVQKNISLGNSYLLNLTFPTLIETEMTLEEIFEVSVAKYKLLYYNSFVVFSPEIFVRIKEGENSERGWYTGVFGVFDGKSLDSAVMIRFIEKDLDKLFYKSGGGITYLSDPVKEYEELISKVYVPVG